MRLCFLLVLFLFIFSPNVYSKNIEIIDETIATINNPTVNAEEEQLFIIKSDDADYNEQKGYVVASGNVSLFSGDTITQADNIFYDLNNEILKINKPFIIKSTKKNKDNIEDYMKGVSLNYNIGEESGEAYNVESQIGGIYFEGKNISFSKNKFVVANSFFTNCPHDKKHFGMKVKSLQVYVEDGAVVIRGAVLKIGRIPIFYIPNYIYGNIPEGTKSQTIIPEVKNDQVRGTYITEKMGYHFHHLFSGILNFEWSKKLGFGVGINNGYKVKNNFFGDARLNYTVNGGFETGIKNNFILWKNKAMDDENQKESDNKKKKKGIFNKLFISFLPDISKGEAQLSLEATHRELVNFRRVSYLPELEFKLKEIIIPALHTQINMVLGIGNIEEEGTLKTRRSFTNFNVHQPLITKDYFNFFTSFNYDHYFYGQGNVWEKMSGRLDWGCKSKYIDLNIGYLKMFKNLGSSPFNFDKYQVVLNDEANWAINLGSDNTKIGINFYYDLSRKNYRIKEYNVLFNLCKWKFKVIWEAVEKNIGISFSLTN